jgi:hypothetical protein
MKIFKIFSVCLLLSLPCAAQAQIGWTLKQCRKHFGHEIQENGYPLLEGATVRTFGIKYHRGFDGRLLFVGFDPDGTVGQIK